MEHRPITLSRVTALVSGYYSEQYIETRLINLNAQGCEIVLVCQAGSAEDEIGKQYGVKVIVTPDIPGLYKAWNIAIRHATGEYLTSANTDDIFYPDALALMMQELERTGADICYSDMDIKKGNDITTLTRPEGGYNKLKRWCFVGPMPVWRKSLHDRFGMFDEAYKVAGDYEFWLRCAKAGAKICKVSKSLGRYLHRPDSLEHRNRDIHNAERKKLRNIYT